MSELARAGLAVIGGLVGGWPGYLVGTIVGGLLFPPASQQKPENLAGMRLAGPTPGTPLPIALGQVRVRGHVIWQGPLIEQRGGKKGGGGGKKGGSQTSYRRSFMHALCEGHPDIQLIRIYHGDDVLWDAYDPEPGEKSGIDFTFYPGTGEDMPDSRMAAYQLNRTMLRVKTIVLYGTEPYYFTEDPIVPDSDVVWTSVDGSIRMFKRVPWESPYPEHPAYMEYAVHYNHRVFQFGGTYNGLPVTIRYRYYVEPQEPLAYRHVCKVYVHEFPLVGQSLPQLTYEICVPVPVIQ